MILGFGTEERRGGDGLVDEREVARVLGGHSIKRGSAVDYPW
jgi:hypothetical protein